MGIDKGAFYSAVRDIEDYLGYLKGNELAYEYLREVHHLNAVLPADVPDNAAFYYAQIDPNYHFPCPEARFWVYLPFPDTQISVLTSDQAGLESFAKEVQANMDLAWRGGAAWASGVASYLIEVAARFMDPDVDTMAGAVLGMQKDVVTELDAGARDNWADIGDLLGNWHGESKHAFYGFYTGYSSALDIFSVVTAQANAGFAAATALINGTQAGALKFVESIRHGLVDLLLAWYDTGRPPVEPAKTPPWVADVLKIGGDVYALLGHVPVVKDVKSQVDNVVKIGDSVSKLVTDVADVAGIDLPELESKDIVVQTADQVYTGVTETLFKRYYQAYVEAMDTMYDGGVSADVDDADNVPFRASAVRDIMKDLQRRNDWYLPEVSPGSLYSAGDPYRF
mgnify:CR=1 FL=1